MTTIASLDFETFPVDSIIAPTAPWSVTGSAPVAATGAAHHGSQGIRWASTGVAGRLMYDFGAAFTEARTLSFYLRFGTLPTENVPLASAFDATAGSAQADLRFLTATGVLQMRNGGSSAGASSPALTAGTTYRIEWMLNPAANQQSLRMYVGDSTTLFHEANGAALASDLSSVFSIGPRTGAAGGVNMDVDSVTIADDWTGPWTGSALSVSAGGDQALDVGDVAELNATVVGGIAPYVYVWTVTSGSGTFDDDNIEDPIFTPSGAGVHVLRLTVTDDITVVAFDEVTITVSGSLPPVSASGWTTIGGGAATRLAAVTDDNPATYVQTAENPVAEVFTVGLPSLQPPSGDLVGRVTLSTTVGSATVTPRLYRPDGTTLVSTATPITVTSSVVENTVTFPAVDITAASLPETDWSSGMVVTYTAAV